MPCCTAVQNPGDGDPRSHWLALLAQLYVQGIELSLAGWGDGFVHPTRMDMPAVVVERVPASVPETGLRKLSSRKPAKAARVHAYRDRTGAPGGAGSPLQKGMDRVMQPSGTRREAVPPFLQDNSDVVRKYFDLSARVLDVAGAYRCLRAAMRPVAVAQRSIGQRSALETSSSSQRRDMPSHAS